MNKYGRGHKDDPPGLKVTPIHLHPAVRRWGGALPPEVMTDTADVTDQIGTSACTVHAVVVAIAPAIGFVASQADSYRLSGSIWRADNHLPLSTPLVDDGREPNEVVRAFQEFGCRPRASSPDYDARNSDIDPANINDEVNGEEFIKDAKTITLGQYECRSPDEMQIAIATTKRALTVAMFCDTKGPRSVEEWDPTTGPLGAPVNPNDPFGGGHQVCVKGYRYVQSVRIWIVQNSWGKNYGLSGMFLANDEWARRLTHKFCWNVRTVSA